MQRLSLARLAWAALVLDVLAVFVSPSATSVVPGFHYPIVAPRAAPWVMGASVLIVAVHVLLAVALWRRLRDGREPSSRALT